MAVNFCVEAPFFGLFDASTGEAVAAGGTVTLTDAPAFAILGSGETSGLQARLGPKDRHSAQLWGSLGPDFLGTGLVLLVFNVLGSSQPERLSSSQPYGFVVIKGGCMIMIRNYL